MYSNIEKLFKVPFGADGQSHEDGASHGDVRKWMQKVGE